MNVGIVGLGTIGSALAEGLREDPHVDAVRGTTKSATSAARATEILDLPVSQNNAELVAWADVVLLCMRIPPNYGPQYTEQFQAVYTDLAKEFGVPVVPFLLEGIALNPALMQADQIHPDELGQPILLANVWPVLQPLLRK